MERSQNVLLMVILNSFFILFLFVLKNSGVNSLVIGTYTIIMFIIISTLFLKMMIKQDNKKSNKENT